MTAFITIVQYILNFLGIIAVIGGVIALIVGNHQRGLELLVGGVSFIVIKYIIGFLYVEFKTDRVPESQLAKATNSRYDQLLIILNAIKNGTASEANRIKISKELINSSEISRGEKDDLLEQLEKVYDSSGS